MNASAEFRATTREHNPDGPLARLQRRDTLNRAGLRVTHPRIKVLAALENNDSRHFSAESLFHAVTRNGDPIGLATVYRVLTQFVEAGLVKRHVFEEGHAVFELDRGEHHDHLVCVRCGKVVEFADAVIEERQAATAERLGFMLGDHAMVLYGVCDATACSSAAAGKNATVGQ